MYPDNMTACTKCGLPVSYANECGCFDEPVQYYVEKFVQTSPDDGEWQETDDIFEGEGAFNDAVDCAKKINASGGEAKVIHYERGRYRVDWKQ